MILSIFFGRIKQSFSEFLFTTLKKLIIAKSIKHPSHKKNETQSQGKQNYSLCSVLSAFHETLDYNLHD